jgi:hypothetical protein
MKMSSSRVRFISNCASFGKCWFTIITSCLCSLHTLCWSYE